MYELLRLQKSKPKTLFTPPSSSSSSSSSPSLFTSAANPAESHSIVRSAGRSTIDVDPSNRELQQSHSRGLHFCKATATNSVRKTLISCKKIQQPHEAAAAVVVLFCAGCMAISEDSSICGLSPVGFADHWVPKSNSVICESRILTLICTKSGS